MMPRFANWPSFHWHIPHEWANTNVSNRIEEVFQNPGEPRTSELHCGFCVHLKQLDLELWLWRRDMLDKKVDSVELEGVGQGLWVPKYWHGLDN